MTNFDMTPSITCLPRMIYNLPQTAFHNSQQTHPLPLPFLDNADVHGAQTLANIANQQYHELNVIQTTRNIVETEMHGFSDGEQGWDLNRGQRVAFASLNDVGNNPQQNGWESVSQEQQPREKTPQQYTMQNYDRNGQHPQYYNTSSSTTTGTAAPTSTSGDNSPLTAYHPLYQVGGEPGPSNHPYHPYQETYSSPNNHNNSYSPTLTDPYTHTHTFSTHSPRHNQDSNLSGSDAYDTLQQQEAELKRLRNTAASARFRAKKKKREASLERNAREKREQLERLEERIQQLEKENMWLRDLILRKGERIGLEEGLGKAKGKGKGKETGEGEGERVVEGGKDGVGT